MANLPAYGTAMIRCGKRKCDWRGVEGDLAKKPHPKFAGATQNVCPTCGCDSYTFMTEKEITALKCATKSKETP